MSRRISFILITVLLAPVLFIALAEGILFVLGYSSTYDYEDPFLGFKDVVPLFERVTESGTSIYRTRASKLEWFNDEKFLAKKPANEYRIFCFGGSTTYGRPYSSATSFSRWLEVILNASDQSDRVYEVVNVGGISYASYRIVTLMKEMTRYDPDLFIVYAGNNEFLEERTYGSILEEPEALTLLRSRMHRLRTYSLLRNTLKGSSDEAREKFMMTGEVDPLLDQSFGLDRYHRDDKKAGAIVRHFRSNLELMSDISAAGGIDMIFIVPATNDRDFSPFRSEHTPELTPDRQRDWDAQYSDALQRILRGDYEGALRVIDDLMPVDDRFADLRFRRGKAMMGLADYDAGQTEFEAARDMDIAPLRATTPIRGAVRAVAAERGIPVLDLPLVLGRILEDRSGYRIPGSEFFYDHCHPTIEVHQMIAESIMTAGRRAFAALGESPWTAIDYAPIYDSVMATLNPAYHGLRDLNLAKVLRWAGKKEEAALFIRRAVSRLPTHPEAWFLLGVAYQESGRFDSAAIAFTNAVQFDPEYAKAYNSLGSIYLQAGQSDRAIALFREAVRFDSSSASAYYNLGNALYRSGMEEEAVSAYRSSLFLQPEYTPALNNLGVVYMNRQAFDLAVPLFEQTTTVDPRNIEAYYNLGVIAALQGSYPRAEEMFHSVLRIAPGDSPSEEWLARIEAEKQKGAPE